MVSNGKTDKAALKKAEKKRKQEWELKRQIRRKNALQNSDGSPRNIVEEFADLFVDFPYSAFSTLPYSSSWSSELFDFIFKLTRMNMEPIYNNTPGWKWNDNEKRHELLDSNARYIIFTEKDGKTPVGFVHYRIEFEDIYDVLYVYEIQLASSTQRKGVGSFAMNLMCQIAKKYNLHKVLLTVQNSNKDAYHFYKNKLGFVNDISCPSISGEEAGYEILCKIVNSDFIRETENFFDVPDEERSVSRH